VIVIIPKFLKTMFMVFLLLLLYAFFGVVVFGNEEEGIEYFPNLGEGMWSLMILLTTANFPDVMMPAYSRHRVASLFFVSFLLLGLFFLLNLLLAQVYSSYEEEKDNVFIRERDHRHNALRLAFDIMTEDQYDKSLYDRRLTHADIQAIFHELNQTHKGVRFISKEEADEKFAQLDEDHSKEIDLGEFYQFGIILEQTYVEVLVPSFMEAWFPEIFNSKWFQKLKDGVESMAFEYFIDLCLILNAVLVVYQVRDELEGKNEELVLGIWDEIGDTVFCTIYFVEMSLKIWVMGFFRYTSNYKNIFDGVITVMGVSAAAYVYYPNSYSDPTLIRYVVFCRILRLVRLVTALKVFQEIGETFVAILPVARRVLVSLFCAMYLFSWIGVELYGGKINTDPDSQESKELEGTDFDAGDYYANNFNDMGSGMITLFELMVVNNWFVIVEGFVAVTDHWSCLFFVLWYASGVLIRLNIVVAFILDCYNDFEEQRMKKEYEEATRTKAVSGQSGAGKRLGAISEDIEPYFPQAPAFERGDSFGTSALSQYERRLLRKSAGIGGPSSSPAPI